MMTFFNYLWKYCTVIFSDHYSTRVTKGVDRLLSGIWLVSCTVLLAAFAGLLREQMMKTLPIRWIDSLDDLYSEEWRDLFILSTDATEIAYARDGGHKEFNIPEEALNRLLTVSHIDYELGLIPSEWNVEQVYEGTVAIWSTLGYLQWFRRQLIKKGLQEDIDFHISRSGTIGQPYFIMINQFRFDTNMTNTLNKM